MENNKTSLMIFITTMVVCYLAVSFIKADINAFNWSEYLRATYCFMSPLFGVLMVSIYQMINNR